MLTVQYAKALENMKVNVVEPGFTATDLNGNRSHQSVAEGAGIIVKMATIGADGPTGTWPRFPWPHELAVQVREICVGFLIRPAAGVSRIRVPPAPR
jgi:NAD(P)-dependent dehydrogenase (short-subunit alcohol dehydrogenase family)